MHLILGGPARAWNVFPAWDGKTWKNLELFEMHSCHWPGAGIWLRHERKLVTASLSLHCIDGYKSFRYWNEVFYAVFHVLDWSFLVLHFDGSVCIWIPKVIWPWLDWFRGFLFKNGFFCWAHIFMGWNLKEYLNCYSFGRFRFFSMLKLRGILVCSVKMLVLFRHWILQSRSIFFKRAMELYFVSFLMSLSLCFLGSIGMNLWLLRKTKKSVFQVFC